MKRHKPIKRGAPPKRKTRLKSGRHPLVRALGKRIKNRGKPRFKQGRDPQYLEWIRGLPCVLTGKRFPDGRPHVCYGPVEATHVRSRGAGGSDIGNVVPCDAYEHAHQHTGGIKSWAQYWFGSYAELRRIAAEVYPQQYEKAKALGFPE